MAVADNLITDETIVFESKKHWMAPIRASLVGGPADHRRRLRPLALARAATASSGRSAGCST